MGSDNKLALTPIAAAIAAALAPGQNALAQDAEENKSARSGGLLEEITVTARKRTESAQDIPINVIGLPR